MRLPRLLAIAAVTTLALGTAACASDDADAPEASTPAPSQSIDTSGAPEASPSPSTEPEPGASDSSESETPAPSDDAQGDGGVAPAAYEQLEGDPPGTIARADLAILDGVPSSSSTVSGAVVSGQTFVIEGQCTGGGASMGFRFERAIDAPPQERLLLEGTLACDAAPSQGFALSAPYDGPAQLTITAADGVTQAWLVARSQ